MTIRLAALTLAITAAVIVGLAPAPMRAGEPPLGAAPSAPSGAESPTRATRSDDLPARVAEIAARDALRGSTLSILVRRLATGETVLALNPDTLVAPASTTKLVSCAGALALLGGDFRFRTRVVPAGPLEDGRLRGDLVLVASGDPNLSQRPTADGHLRFADSDHTYAGFASDARVVPGDPLAVLDRLARDVARAGVREIQGDVIVDDGLFDEVEDSFVGPFSAICVNDNVVDIVLTPASKPGSRASVRVSPDLRSIEVRNRVRTVEPDGELRIWVEERPGPSAFEVRGQIPAGHEPVLRVGRIANPSLAVATWFGELLERRGVEIDGRERRGRFGPTVYRSYSPLAEHESPPLSEAIRVILKVSHNLHATMLPVFVGAHLGTRGVRSAGYDLVREHFRESGLDVDSVILESGSGGGRIDRLSARFLVDLLTYMSRRDDFPVFLRALPVGGVDGTLASHFRSDALRGQVHAKTGTLLYRGSFNDRWIYLSKALAGYFDVGGGPDRGGERLVFSITIANTVCADRDEGARLLFRAQEDILEAVAASLATAEE